MDCENKYDDIINLPHHKSKTRPQMARIERAAQFAPFSALTGYDEAVRETARLTGDKIELDEYEKERINNKLQFILEQGSECSCVVITYYVPDEKKKGGKYASVCGCVKKIDTYERTLVLEDGLEIAVDNILSVDIAE